MDKELRKCEVLLKQGKMSLLYRLISFHSILQVGLGCGGIFGLYLAQNYDVSLKYYAFHI